MEEEPLNVFQIKPIDNRHYRVNAINPIYFTKDTSTIIDKMKQQVNNSFENNDDVDSYSGDSDFLKEHNNEDFIPQESDLA